MTTKSETKTVVKQKSVVKEVETKVYVGPTIPGVVTEGTIYNNGIPEVLDAVAKEEPAINSLIVKISYLAKARNELKNNGPMSIFYAKALEYKEKKGDK
ncbi:hypothetical protein lbkm_0685 [Lachnospiraceae bacterium KM106-2]|nr:hypothetical protein lbkm_0685 [Lachnospiraceae bacterium KM106-2]